mmetsp:Transcript_63764/g.186496  ORF Transcript_63764/g.186496 Transcript_63764/m.186496 type:complete len:389 (+) Transcript_63764:96-1262(+)
MSSSRGTYRPATPTGTRPRAGGSCRGTSSVARGACACTTLTVGETRRRTVGARPAAATAASLLHVASTTCISETSIWHSRTSRSCLRMSLICCSSLSRPRAAPRQAQRQVWKAQAAKACGSHAALLAAARVAMAATPSTVSRKRPASCLLHPVRASCARWRDRKVQTLSAMFLPASCPLALSVDVSFQSISSHSSREPKQSCRQRPRAVSARSRSRRMPRRRRRRSRPREEWPWASASPCKSFRATARSSSEAAQRRSSQTLTQAPKTTPNVLQAPWLVSTELMHAEWRRWLRACRSTCAMAMRQRCRAARALPMAKARAALCSASPCLCLRPSAASATAALAAALRETRCISSSVLCCCEAFSLARTVSQSARAQACRTNTRVSLAP